ncbi:MAG TPA: GNAT family N-acetyltransferase [Candidatus Saccharimonadales bacterium]|nr:GNAT family N-acetyltransferase [Candidatus Saccharimonadales bacterium]
MTVPNFHETYRRVEERFNRTLEDEGLTVEGPLDNTELLSRYEGQLVELAGNTYEFSDESSAEEWINGCTSYLGFKAAILANEQQELVGFTWAHPFSIERDITVDGARDFVEEKREELAVGSQDVLYSTALAIDPEYQGKGLGSGLALAALNLCREEYPDGSLLFYRTKPTNSTTRYMSETLGAKQVDIPDTQSGKIIWHGYIPPLETSRN